MAPAASYSHSGWKLYCTLFELRSGKSRRVAKLYIQPWGGQQLNIRRCQSCCTLKGSAEPWALPSPLHVKKAAYQSRLSRYGIVVSVLYAMCDYEHYISYASHPPFH